MSNYYDYRQKDSRIYSPPISQNSPMQSSDRKRLTAIVALVLIASVVLFVPYIPTKTPFTVQDTVFTDYGKSLISTAISSEQDGMHYFFKQEYSQIKKVSTTQPALFPLPAEKSIVLNAGNAALLVTLSAATSKGFPVTMHTWNDDGYNEQRTAELYLKPISVTADTDTVEFPVHSWLDKAFLLAFNKDDEPVLITYNGTTYEEIRIKEHSAYEEGIQVTEVRRDIGGKNTDSFFPYFTLLLSDARAIGVSLGQAEEGKYYITEPLYGSQQVVLAETEAETDSGEDTSTTDTEVTPPLTPEEYDALSLDEQIQHLFEEARSSSDEPVVGTWENPFSAQTLKPESIYLDSSIFTPLMLAMNEYARAYYTGLMVPFLSAADNTGDSFYISLVKGEEVEAFFGTKILPQSTADTTVLEEYTLNRLNRGIFTLATAAQPLPSISLVGYNYYLVSGCTKQPARDYANPSDTLLYGNWVWFFIDGLYGEMDGSMTLTDAKEAELQSLASSTYYGLDYDYNIYFSSDTTMKKITGKRESGITRHLINDSLRPVKSLLQYLIEKAKVDE